MLSWQMLAAGIPPPSLDNRSRAVSASFFLDSTLHRRLARRCLKFTDARGTEAMGNKQERASSFAVIHHTKVP